MGDEPHRAVVVAAVDELGDVALVVDPGLARRSGTPGRDG
jgi:hypothetical protein